MNWNSRKGKSQLIREIVEKGFSWRRGEAAVNAVFDCMKHALRRGEIVEIPGGSICVTLGPWKRRAFRRFTNIATGEKFYRLFDYPTIRHRIQFRSDKTLNLDPLPAPAATPSPEYAELREIVATLTGQPATDAAVAELQRAMDGYDVEPGALVRRLRRMRSFGWGIPPEWAYDIANAVGYLCRQT